MEYIRVVHQKHYDPRKREFKSLAFKNSSSGGISVISKNCIDETSRHVCAHIFKFYSIISSNPQIYWRFSFKILPDGCEFIAYESESGDKCHGDITGLTNQKARALLKSIQIDQFEICEGQESSRPLEIEDLVCSDQKNILPEKT